MISNLFHNNLSLHIGYRENFFQQNAQNQENFVPHGRFKLQHSNMAQIHLANKEALTVLCSVVKNAGSG